MMAYENRHMNYRRKSLASILLIAVLGTTLSFAFPRRADAFWGIGDIVSDPVHTLETVGGWAATAAEWVYEKAFTIVLERLKKRLLDTVTDQIISWIQYGNEPQFISNFGDVFTDAADAAVGDMLLENAKYGLDRFCSSQTGPLLNLVLRQSQGSFSRAPSCTLSQVVGNVEAFTDDFSRGGWLGLQALANPQNNRYGQFIVMTDRLQRLIQEKQRAAELETQANNGFTSTKQCIEWRRNVLRADNTDVEEILMPGKDTPVIPWVNAFYDPANVPPSQIDPASASAVGYRPGIYPWECSKTDITTPGTVAQEGANRAIYSDIDYLIGSTELTPYLGAIADAALNRLTTETYRGLKGMMQSQTTNPTPAGPPAYTPPIAVRNASTSYADVRNSGAEQSRQSLLNRVNAALKDAQSDLPTLSPLRARLVGIIGGVVTGYGYGIPDIVSCLATCPAVPELAADTAWAQNAALAAQAASTTLSRLEQGPTRIAQTIGDLTLLQTRLMSAASSDVLAGINTSALTTATSNHASLVDVTGFINTTPGSVSSRLLYCGGDVSRTPPINACSPYPGQ